MVKTDSNDRGRYLDKEEEAGRKQVRKENGIL
jgi:hypothetical protein